MNKDSAILVCGHGSRDGEAVAEFARFVEAFAGLVSERLVESASLELARPTIGEGLERLVLAGARRIQVLPAMLMSANHVNADIPAAVEAFATAHPGIDIRIEPGFGVESKLADAAQHRIEAAEASAAKQIARADTLLLFTAHGAQDPAANERLGCIGTTLSERMGFGRGITAFAGGAQPKFEESLDQAAGMGFARILVFPYFLFTGKFVKRIYESADAMAAWHPGLDILKAHYLADHPLVIDCLLHRVRFNPPAN